MAVPPVAPFRRVRLCLGRQDQAWFHTRGAPGTAHGDAAMVALPRSPVWRLLQSLVAAVPNGFTHGPNSRRRSSCRRPALRLAVSLAALLVCDEAAAQRPGHPEIQRAVAAYEAGELDRARLLLEGAPALLSPRDAAIRSLYLGLVHFAAGDIDFSRDAFMRAVILDPALRIDAAVHSPTRVQAFDAARAVAIEGWRTEATAAAARGDVVLAEQRWRSVLLAEPADSAASASLAAIEAARRPAPPITLPPTDTAGVEEVPADSASQIGAARNPGQALALGLLLPGLGEIYAGRPVVGILALGAAGGALAAAFMVEKVDVRCATVPVNNFCPPEDVVSESTERPWMGAGLAAAAGITLLGAIDAFLAARRANVTLIEGGGAAVHVGPAALAPVRDGGVRIDWIRIAF